jgi:hypothetical protein
LPVPGAVLIPLAVAYLPRARGMALRLAVSVLQTVLASVQLLQRVRAELHAGFCHCF